MEANINIKVHPSIFCHLSHLLLGWPKDPHSFSSMGPLWGLLPVRCLWRTFKRGCMDPDQLPKLAPGSVPETAALFWTPFCRVEAFCISFFWLLPKLHNHRGGLEGKLIGSDLRWNWKLGSSSLGPSSPCSFTRNTLGFLSIFNCS